jgi:hypothetical protein
MVKNLLVGFPMMALCLLVQISAVYWSVHGYARRSARPGQPTAFLRASMPLVYAMLMMMLGNVAQIALWGALFVLVGEFGDLYEAVYHSAVNYASLGYGDIVMSREWKLLGPLEALNGVLMVGMSGATLVAILQQMITVQRGAEGHPD